MTESQKIQKMFKILKIQKMLKILRKGVSLSQYRNYCVKKINLEARVKMENCYESLTKGNPND